MPSSQVMFQKRSLHVYIDEQLFQIFLNNPFSKTKSRNLALTLRAYYLDRRLPRLGKRSSYIHTHIYIYMYDELLEAGHSSSLCTLCTMCITKPLVLDVACKPGLRQYSRIPQCWRQGVALSALWPQKTWSKTLCVLGLLWFYGLTTSQARSEWEPTWKSAHSW